MNASSSNTAQSPLDSGLAKPTDGHDATPARRADAAPDVHNLLADIQDLLGQLAHVADPDIARVRARLLDTLATARRAVTDGSEQIRRQVRNGVRGGDAYVRNQPWQAVGIAAAAGLLIGFLVAKR
jgi:ElaB/YqjD/DUF883 family membrane-anchored ribosome-binding protein